MAQSTCSKVSVSITVIIGIVCCITGGVLYKVFPDIVKEKIVENVKLKNGTEGYKKWTDDSSIYWKVYFFNITNPDDVMKNSKPILQEVGPYVFRQTKTKENLVRVNATIEYDETRTWYHESGDINEQIYHLNALYVIMADTASIFLSAVFKSPIDNKTLQDMVDDKTLKLVEKHSVLEILFQGYDSKLIHQTKKMEGMIRGQMQAKYHNSDNFGLYYGKNGTKENNFVVDTGEADIQNLGKIIQSDGKKKVGNWKSNKYCTAINGTDGTMFAPDVKKSEKIYVFSSELTRSVYFEYEKEVAVEDIVAYKFTMPESLFNVNNKENECFCDRTEICKNGLLKIIPIINFNPKPDDKDSQKIIFSAPHFYHGDKSLLDYVDGLQPQKEKHESFLDVEPNTGVVIKAAKRLQVNAHLRPVNLPLLKDVKETVFPIAWVEESAEIDAETAKKFRAEVLNPLDKFPTLFIALIALGAFLITVSAIACIYKVRF